MVAFSALTLLAWHQEEHTPATTSSSAIAEVLHDASSQLKSCQLLHNCTRLVGWLVGV